MPTKSLVIAEGLRGYPIEFSDHALWYCHTVFLSLSLLAIAYALSGVSPGCRSGLIQGDVSSGASSLLG